MCRGREIPEPSLTDGATYTSRFEMVDPELGMDVPIQRMSRSGQDMLPGCW